MRFSDKMMLQAYGLRHPTCNISEAAAILAAAGITAATTGVSMTIGGRMNRRAARQAEDARRWQTSERLSSQKYQQQFYQQQLADQQMLYEKYESPEAQARQMKEAGFSPLAALNGSMALSNGMTAPNPSSAPSAPGASLPQLFNPGTAAQEGAAQFGQFLTQFAAMRETEAKIPVFKSQAEKNAAETATINAMRAGEVEFQGVRIKLALSEKELNESKLKVNAQAIAESEKRIEQYDQFIKESGVRIDYTQWKKYAEQQKLPKEVEEMASKIVLNWALRGESLSRSRMNQASTTGIKLDNKMKYEYQKPRKDKNGREFSYMADEMYQQWQRSTGDHNLYKRWYNKYAKDEQEFDYAAKEYAFKMQYHSDFVINTVKGARAIGSVVSAASEAAGGFAKYAAGRQSLAKTKMMLNNAQNGGNIINPALSIDDAGSVYNPFFQ